MKFAGTKTIEKGLKKLYLLKGNVHSVMYM
jgi:hypothetical protein